MASKGEAVAVRGVDFLDQTVGAQQGQFARDGGALLALEVSVAGCAWKKTRSQVFLAEAVDGKFASVDGFQQAQIIFGLGAQTTMVTAFGLNPAAKRSQHLAKCDSGRGRRQRMDRKR
jgi:hypothetical protein